MRQTTNFKDWLKGPSRPRTSYDLYALWRASCGRSEGQYQAQLWPATEGRQRLLIGGPANEVLFLPSGRAIGAFKMALEAQQVLPLSKYVWAEVEESPDAISVKIKSGGTRRFR